MAETPFYDILSPPQQAIVSRRSRGENRPYYYDSTVALAALASKTATQGGSEDLLSPEEELLRAGQVQISIDLEAAIILTPSEITKEIRSFIQEANRVATSFNQDDFALMTEVVLTRRTNYGQIAKDVGEKVLQFDAARSKFLAKLEANARGVDQGEQNNPDAPDAAAVTAIVIPQLSVFFASLQDAYSVLSKPDDLAVHDRISDAGILYTVQNAALQRSNELSSWDRVFQTYLG